MKRKLTTKSIAAILKRKGHDVCDVRRTKTQTSGYTDFIARVWAHTYIGNGLKRDRVRGKIRPAAAALKRHPEMGSVRHKHDGRFVFFWLRKKVTA